ncbi:MAG TPA: enoyl-CoA hydratase [Burkholderiales bacterium]|nr:enoyl-CoA hydratase [Burkholderiales bacterium]
MPIPPPTVAAGAPLCERRDAGGVTTLTLNRPQQYNALSLALIEELEAGLDSIARDAAVRVVVLAGAGKAFCAGHDLKELRAHAGGDFAREAFERFARCMVALTRLPQPVVARVHGFAFAAGCQLVAQCDLAVASTEARFATSGVNFGLFCNTPGVALARNVSRKVAMEMLLTGEAIDARTALARGLVNRVVPPDELDREIARLTGSILAKTPVAIAAGKRAFYRQIEAGLEEAYAQATEAMVCNLMTEDAAEGIDAFVQKRPPQWKNR